MTDNTHDQSQPDTSQPEVPNTNPDSLENEIKEIEQRVLMGDTASSYLFGK